MPVFEKRSEMPTSRAALFAYHAKAGALERLLPPWQRVRIIENAGPLRDGKRVVMKMKLGPVWKTWEAEQFDFVEGEQFRDRALRGPFKAWTHTHRFGDAATPASSVLSDHVEYELPFGPLGKVGGGHIRHELARVFEYRHARTRHDVARHAPFADRPRLRIAVSGARGAIASNLIPFLTTGGHSVSKLVRGAAKGDEQIAWHADSGEVDQARLGECDALIHLAGQNIAVRWTPKRRAAIWRSRVDATRKLCETLARMPRRPGVLVCASAIGFYGDRGEAALDESSPRGEGFAAELCEAWEAATAPAREAGIRVVNVRIGIVLSANSGALPKLLTPTKLGVAGRVGSGAQWQSWVSMEDLVGVMHEALFRDDWRGPINAVAGSVRQVDFINTLGRVLRRPTVVPLPAIAVRGLFGQMGKELLLASADVRATKLRAAGFEWMLPTLEGALRFELGR